MRCARLAAETAGRQTCGLESGVNILAAVCAVMILGGIYFLTRWRFPQKS